MCGEAGGRGGGADMDARAAARRSDKAEIETKIHGDRVAVEFRRAERERELRRPAGADCRDPDARDPDARVGRAGEDL